eukprot:403338175
MKLRCQFLIFSILMFLISLFGVSFFTQYQISQIIKEKFNPFILKIYFSKMSDISLSITRNIKDEFQILQTDLMIAKRLAEKFSAQTINNQFEQYRSRVSVDGYAEGIKKTPPFYPFDYSKHDWYFTPLNRTQYPEYLVGATQQADIKQCDYSYYFFHALSNTTYLVTDKKSQYYGYESEIFCSHPSQNNSIWTGANAASSKCRQTIDKNGQQIQWYSPTCRGWYIQQKEQQSYTLFQDLYVFAADKRLGMTVCAPILRANLSYYGAHCKDIYPTLNQQNNNFFTYQYLDQIKANYILFQKDSQFYNKNYGNFLNQMSQIIFNSETNVLRGFELDEDYKSDEIDIAYFKRGDTQFAFIMTKVKIKLQKMNKQLEDKYKEFDFGLVFQGDYITKGKQAIIDKIRNIFIVNFLTPYVCIFVFFAFGYICFLIWFSTRIFNPMDELYEKIEVMIQKHVEAERIQQSKQSDKYQVTHLLTKSTKRMDLQAKQQPTGNVNFEYKKTQRELNQLYDAANLFVKTLRVAKQAFLVGDHNKALLNYNEIAQSLGKESQKLGICYNNIGCIHLNLKDRKPVVYFENAVRMQEERLQQITRDKPEYKTQVFIYACRLYNLSLAYCRQFKALYKKNIYEFDDLKPEVTMKFSDLYENIRFNQNQSISQFEILQDQFLDFITLIHIQQLEFYCFYYQTLNLRSTEEISDIKESMQHIRDKLCIIASKGDNEFLLFSKRKGLEYQEHGILSQYFIFTLGLYHELLKNESHQALKLYEISLGIHDKQNTKVSHQCLKRSYNLIMSNTDLELQRMTDLQLRINLSKFYISQRAVTLIVDTSLQKPGQYYQVQQQIFEFTEKIFSKLEGDDSFGMITMQNGTYKNTDIQLEKKALNTIIKKTFISGMKDKYVSSYSKDNQMSSFSQAIDEALLQNQDSNQNQALANKETQKFGFQGPIRWIIATVNSQIQESDIKEAIGLIDRYKRRTKHSKESQINIIVIGIDLQKRDNLVKLYDQLCKSTNQGFFVNLQYQSKDMQTPIGGNNFNILGGLSKSTVSRFISQSVIGQKSDGKNMEEIKKNLKNVINTIQLFKKQRLPLITEKFEFK